MILQTSAIDIEKVKDAIRQDTLNFIEYRDLNCKYPNVYRAYRSNQPRYSNYKNTKYSKMSSYNISMYIKEIGYYINMGRLHPHDLLSKLVDVGEYIEVSAVEFR